MTNPASDGPQPGVATSEEPEQRPSQQSREGAEAPKDRTTIACLQCRSRKRRCDGRKPACSVCFSRQLDCEYPPVLKRRGAAKDKQRMKALEERLIQLEADLGQRYSAALRTEDAEHTNNADLPVTRPSRPMEPSSGTPKAGQTSAGASTPSTGPPTTGSSPTPLIHMFTQCAERMMVLQASDPTGYLKRVEVDSPIVPHPAELSLMRAVEEICKEFPFFNAREFLDQAREQWHGISSIEACGATSRWARLNAAMALSMHLKMANRSFEQLSPIAWGYFKNAYATLPELMLQGNDLETVQALVFMVLFSRGSADARTTSLLLSTALRLSQALDPSLFETGDGGSRSLVEGEYARSALWTAFALDAELSLCCGLNPTLGDGDAELPKEDFHDWYGGGPPSQGEKWGRRIFRWRAELATIHSVVRTRLYAREAFKMPDNQLLATIVTLDQDLEGWKMKLPLEVRPGVDEADLDPQMTILHLAFQNLTAMIHWPARRHSAWEAAATGRLGELLGINLSRLKVRAAAQHTLRVLRPSPFEQFSQFWQNLCYPLSAAMILLLCVLEDPRDPQAETDAQLLREFGLQVQNKQAEVDFEISSLTKTCLGLEQIAYAAIAQAQNGESLEARPRLQPNAIRRAKDLLSSATHPMYVAQGLLTNLPNRDARVSQSIAQVLGILPTENNPYGQLVPACMIPATYSFSFRAGVQNGSEG